MPAKYGITTAAGAPKLAATTVARWNDKVKRHTLYTVCGTSADGWGLWNTPDQQKLQRMLALAKQVTGNNSLTVNDFPADGTFTPSWALSPDTYVGRMANPAIYNWVPISYPAAGPGSTPGSLENNWDPTKYSMAESVKLGVAELINQIKSTPGTFALCGMSQGAVVVSQVLKALLPGGSLASRYNDCIAGVAFGNPCRAAGASFPGGTPAAGAGVLSLPNPNDPGTGGLAGVATPPWWWELSASGDFFASAPVDGVAGPVLSPAIQAVFHMPGTLATPPGNPSANDQLVILTTLIVVGGTAIGLVLTALAQGSFRESAKRLTDFMGSNQMKSWLSQISQRQSQTVAGIMSQWIYEQFGVLNVQASLQQKIPVVTPSGFYPNGNPHVRLGLDKPPTLPSGVIPASGGAPAWTINLPGINSNSTYTDVGVAYINARGAAIAPR